MQIENKDFEGFEGALLPMCAELGATLHRSTANRAIFVHGDENLVADRIPRELIYIPRIEKHADYIKITLPGATGVTHLKTKKDIELAVKGFTRNKVKVNGENAACTPMMPPKRTKLNVQVFIQLPEKAEIPGGLEPKKWAFGTFRPYSVELFQKDTSM
eukprot:sb/3472969/